jgi:hypothetical protein
MIMPEQVYIDLIDTIQAEPEILYKIITRDMDISVWPETVWQSKQSKTVSSPKTKRRKNEQVKIEDHAYDVFCNKICSPETTCPSVILSLILQHLREK